MLLRNCDKNSAYLLANRADSVSRRDYPGSLQRHVRRVRTASGNQLG